MFKKFLVSLLLLVASVSGTSFASEGGVHWDEAPINLRDKASLQNGAKLFVNYCMNCHSANLVRYSHLQELGLTEKQIEENLLFTGKKVGDKMTIAMDRKDAKLWFGVTPPDLSVMARAKSANLGQPGTDYIYTYLRTFYRDKSRATGWNNIVFPNSAMPNPFWEQMSPVEVTITDIVEQAKEGAGTEWHEVVSVIDEHGYRKQVSDKALPDYKGVASSHQEIKYLNPEKQAEFDKDVADLTAFLGWMSEPHQEFRKTLGLWVMLFLAIFFVFAWQLNKAYWKHVK